MVQARHRRLAAPFGAAPDGGDVGKVEVFAQQRPRHGGQIGVHGGGFDHAPAQCIGQHDRAGAHRLHQAGHAQGAVAAQFQGIAEIRIHPAEDDGDALQPGQGLEEHRAVAHRQIVALHQRQAQIMGQIDMLEIGFVVGAGGQQHGAVAARMAQRQNVFAIGVEEGGQPRHPQAGEILREGLRHHQPVFQRIPQPAGRVGTAGQHPPRSVGAARQVGGIQMHMNIPGRARATERAQELGMAGHQMGGQDILLHQPLRAIHVAQDQVGQHGALDHGAFDPGPVVRRQDERHDVELPGPRLPSLVVIDVIGDAIVLHRGAGRQLAARELLRRQVGEGFGEGAPVRAHRSVRVAQFIETCRRGRGLGKSGIRHGQTQTLRRGPGV